jgi:hypothetical protein
VFINAKTLDNIWTEYQGFLGIKITDRIKKKEVIITNTYLF